MSGVGQTFTDESGEDLNIFQSADWPGAVAVRTSDTVRIAPALLPQVAAALYAAAGKPEPVILDRPEPVESFNIAYTTFTAADGRVVVRRPDNSPWEFGVTYEPANIRRWAATLALIADEAERNEPDPAEVEELATLLHDTRETGVKGIYGDWDLSAARAALRWMKQREASRND